MTDEQLTPSEWGERLTGPAHHFGIICGIERAAKILRAKSGECYAVNKDDYAESYRQAAVILEEQASEMRLDEYQERLQEQRSEAFVELEKIDLELDSLRKEVAQLVAESDPGIS